MSNYLPENPLHHAVWNDKYKDVVDLVQQSYDVNSKTSTGITPLEIAIKKKNIGIMMYLINKGADPNVRFDNGFTPLIYSIKFNNLEMVRILIEAGANVNDAIPSDGYTALIFAIDENNLDVVKMLVENGADINLRYFLGSPLYRAVSNNCEEIVIYLLDKDVIVNNKEPYMLRALKNGSNIILQALLKAGVCYPTF